MPVTGIVIPSCPQALPRRPPANRVGRRAFAPAAFYLTMRTMCHAPPEHN